jgi:DNA polymerase
MSTEQPDLFSKILPHEKGNYIEVAANEYIPFIPGVKAEEAYLNILSYDELKEIAVKCHRCCLRDTCKQVIFGEGNKNSKIMFIGEGPGRDEDIQGKPFVGRAGQLLDKILKASDLPRREVYISNVVKCRPPGNRLPNPDEVKECRNYLEAQIRIIRPEIIVCLGAMASQVIIDSKARISKIRGNWFTRRGISIIATYHPAALLRNEGYKRPTWEDFKSIRDKYYKVKNSK